MTFKDLQKLVESEEASSSDGSPEMRKLLTRLRDKPFWINSEKEHKERDRTSKGDCCFNHIIGLPKMFVCIGLIARNNNKRRYYNQG